VAHSPGRIDFTTVTVGLELRAFARSLVSPYARLEAGHLTEKIGDCFVAGWGLGLSVRATRRLSLRGGIMANRHCYDGHGPLVASAGLEFRW
jgi:hypothetical protein